MQEVTIKKDNKIVLDKTVLDFLNPKFIFIPMKEGFSIKVTDKSYVYKNDIIAMDGDGNMLYSSISGTVLGTKTMYYAFKKEVKSLVIENDFKENIRARKSSKRYINTISKEEAESILEDITLYYKGVYLRDKLKNKSEAIIVNAVDAEPYFGNKYHLLKNNIDDLLEAVDVIANLVEAKKVIFVIKNSDNSMVVSMMDSLGTYPNIELKLINDAYPNGLDEILEKKFGKPGTAVFDLEEVNNIFEVLRREVPVTEKLITITGSSIKPCKVVRVKMGSLLSEVFVNNFDFTSPKVDVYLNGMMRGEIVSSLNVVVDSDVDGILVMEKANREEEACLNCGLCSRNCPMGLNPKYVFDHKGNVKPAYYEKCIKCGLCNYMCPSNRNLMSYMKGSDRT